jgi:hypothetical protein
MQARGALFRIHNAAMLLEKSINQLFILYSRLFGD